jgi:glutaredoxin-dependent peroxiredoxin
MALSIGDKAPDFTLPETMETTWKLSEHIGTNNIVLLFFPLAFSSNCREELCAIRDGFREFQGLDATVVAVSIDSPFVLAKFKEDLGLQFPLLSDFNKKVAPAYGAFHETLGPLEGVAKRSAFIIDKAGKIAYEWISDDPGVLPDVAEIMDKLDEIK